MREGKGGGTSAHTFGKKREKRVPGFVISRKEGEEGDSGAHTG